MVIARCPLVLPVGIVAVATGLPSRLAVDAYFALTGRGGDASDASPAKNCGSIWRSVLAGANWLFNWRIARADSGTDYRHLWRERLLDTPNSDVAQRTPHLALIPLVVLWFGIDESAKSSRWLRHAIPPFISIPGMASVIIDPASGYSRVALWIIRAYRQLSMGSRLCPPPIMVRALLPATFTLTVAETISPIQALVIWRYAREFLQTGSVVVAYYSLRPARQTC